MKRCPACNRTYDDTLSFCLDDGSRLTIRIGGETTQPYSPRRTDPPITEVFPPASHGIGFQDIGASSKQLERPGTSSRKIHGLAITSLVLGLIPCTCVPSILAIVFGHIALSRIASSPDRYRGRVMALWGTGLGYFFTVCNLIYGIVRGILATHQ